MSAQILNPDELAAAARAALEQTVETKVAAVRTLVERAAATEDAERRAAEARTALDGAWSQALSTGWSDKELRQLGLAAPGESRPRLKRPSAQKRREPAPAASAAPADE